MAPRIAPKVWICLLLVCLFVGIVGLQLASWLQMADVVSTEVVMAKPLYLCLSVGRQDLRTRGMEVLQGCCCVPRLDMVAKFTPPQISSVSSAHTRGRFS